MEPLPAGVYRSCLLVHGGHLYISLAPHSPSCIDLRGVLRATVGDSGHSTRAERSACVGSAQHARHGRGTDHTEA